MTVGDEKTIVAQCTPVGSGAIALIRICGQDAIRIVEKISLLASQKNLITLPTNTIHYGWVVDENKNNVDRVLFLLMHAPKTFTGQDTVEITCHNNPFIIEQIIELTIKNGARPAAAGEFTKRAFLNEKIDLVQAEAINELIHANTQTTLKHALAQVEGSFSSWVLALEKQLLEALSYSDISLEFLEEEEIEFSGKIKKILNSILSTIAKLKETFDQQQLLRQGIRIAIVGNVNAGKSSLFNAILDKNRAIVTNVPGTTRDSIEAGIYRNGNYWTLIDTAGLRKSNDKIEQEGIRRAENEARSADIILLVADGANKLSAEEKKLYLGLIENNKEKIITIKNKADLEQKNNDWIDKIKPINVSTKNKTNIHIVVKTIEQKVKTLLEKHDAPFLINKRHYNILLSLEKEITSIIKMISENTSFELLSYHIKEALENLTELTGKTIDSKNLDFIFNNFCVGK